MPENDAPAAAPDPEPEIDQVVLLAGPRRESLPPPPLNAVATGAEPLPRVKESFPPPPAMTTCVTPARSMESTRPDAPVSAAVPPENEST